MVPESSRREALRAVAALGASTAGAGCVGRLRAHHEYPRAEVTSQDDIPVDHADVEAEVVAGFTDDHPARVRVAFTNPTDETRSYGFSASPPFSDLYGHPPGEDRPERFLLLAPLSSTVHVAAGEVADGPDSVGPDPADIVPDEPTDGCWRARGGIHADPIGVGRTLGPGETLAETYAVLAARESEADGCEVVGDWRFESNSYFDSDRWSFTLTVE